jgi:hypothetical protein
MLREIPYVRQIPGEPRRRWFDSPSCDLIVWYSEANTPIGFQLCYDKSGAEKTLTWRAPNTYAHAAVDDGEKRALHYKGTPILVAAGNFDAPRITELFHQESSELPSDVVELIISKLREHTGHR